MLTDETDLVYRLRKRAEIRRQASTRKSVQEGKPDRISDILEEAADEIEQLRYSKMNLLTRVGRSTLVLVNLSNYQWYRRWYGGRWERHWIDVCMSLIWLDMHPDRKWPKYRQPCSHGTPEIEDYPIKGPSRI